MAGTYIGGKAGEFLGNMFQRTTQMSVVKLHRLSQSLLHAGEQGPPLLGPGTTYVPVAAMTEEVSRQGLASTGSMLLGAAEGVEALSSGVNYAMSPIMGGTVTGVGNTVSLPDLTRTSWSAPDVGQTRVVADMIGTDNGISSLAMALAAEKPSPTLQRVQPGLTRVQPQDLSNMVDQLPSPLRRVTRTVSQLGSTVIDQEMRRRVSMVVGDATQQAITRAVMGSGGAVVVEKQRRPKRPTP